MFFHSKFMKVSNNSNLFEWDPADSAWSPNNYHQNHERQGELCNHISLHKGNIEKHIFHTHWAAMNKLDSIFADQIFAWPNLPWLILRQTEFMLTGFSCLNFRRRFLATEITVLPPYEVKKWSNWSENEILWRICIRGAIFY